MLYDYKSDKLTQEEYITCICPIVDDLIDEYSTLRRYDNLSIYAPSYIVREILGRLLDETDDLWVHTDSDISLIYADGNDLVVTIACDRMIFIESAKNDGIIKSNEDCCLTYFYDGLGKKDLNALEKNAEAILVFGFEGDDCEGCKSENENTELSIESDGDMHGFSVNRSDENGYSSYSFYSDNMELVEYMAKLFR
jgi:hypothetical protein